MKTSKKGYWLWWLVSIVVLLISIVIVKNFSFASYFKYIGFGTVMIGGLVSCRHQIAASKKAGETNFTKELTAFWFICAGAILSTFSTFSEDVTKKADDARQTAAHKIELEKQQKHVDMIADEQRRREEGLQKEAQDLQKRAEEQKVRDEDSAIKADRANRALQSATKENARAEAIHSQIVKDRVADEARRSREYNHDLTMSVRVSETEHSLRNLQETLNGFANTVNPIENMTVSYSVKIPLNHPIFLDYHSKLVGAFQEYRQYVATVKPGGELKYKDFDGLLQLTYADNRGKAKVMTGIAITRGSKLFPSDNTFPGSVFTYQFKVLLWHKTIPTHASLEEMPLPDLMASTSTAREPQPDLVYTPEDDTLHLLYNNAFVPVSKMTGKITTVPNALGAKVMFFRNVYQGADGKLQAQPVVNEIGKYCIVDRLDIVISGREFLFESNDLKHTFDPLYGSVCQFELNETVKNWNSIKYKIAR